MSLTHRDQISVIGQIRRIHNEMNGYSRRSPFKGLARSGMYGSDLRWLLTGRGCWTWKHWRRGGSECGATWKSGPSAATRAADFTGGGGDYTAEGELTGQGSTRRGTSSTSDFTDVRSRDVGSNRRNDVWSPANVLVDMVARMQQDLANLRVENRLLRTRGFLR